MIGYTMEVSPSRSNATARDDGYLYPLAVWRGATYDRKRSEFGELHADKWYNVLYFVSDESVYRMTQSESNEFEEPFPDPREKGTAVTCPPGDDD